MLLRLGPLLLGSDGTRSGCAPSLVNVPVGLAAGRVVGDTVPVSLEIWHGVSATLLLSAATLVGSISLFIYRERMRRLVWPRSLGTERLYTLSLAGLDAISRWTAPALQNASLRSYVLIVVLTGVAFVAMALAAGGVLPTLSRWTPIEPYEAWLRCLLSQPLCWRHSRART